MQPPPALWIPILDLICRGSPRISREGKKGERNRGSEINSSSLFVSFFKDMYKKMEINTRDLYYTWYNFVVRGVKLSNRNVIESGELRFSQISEFNLTDTDFLSIERKEKIVESDKFANSRKSIYIHISVFLLWRSVGSHLRQESIP